MKLLFSKYQGTGNDFVMVDNRSGIYQTHQLPVSKICDRRFGVGADGLIVIENHNILDFNMVYFNSDGSQSFCGNGSRCAVIFAHQLGIIKNKTQFLSTDGEHSAAILPNGDVKLKMHNVQHIFKRGLDFELNTGSPHYVRYTNDLDQIELVADARQVRYAKPYAELGINVNFIESQKDIIKIRTYERGVEDETLSCGTGVTAVALAHHTYLGSELGAFTQEVHAVGGNLLVHFQFDGKMYEDVYLQGPAKFVFSGEIDI